MADRLFISHASEDAATAARIVGHLEARGVACWISSRDIPPRAIYADAITEAVRDCTACAVLLSKAAIASKAVKRELELASHYDKPFIPVRVDRTEPTAGVEYYLRGVQWEDYVSAGEAALDRIARHLLAAQPGNAASIDSGNLNNTYWWGFRRFSDGKQLQYGWFLRSDGVACCGSELGKTISGFGYLWRAEGNKVTISRASHGLSDGLSGVVNGELFSGRETGIKGDPTFEFRKSNLIPEVR